jgi:sortase B
MVFRTSGDHGIKDSVIRAVVYRRDKTMSRQAVQSNKNSFSYSDVLKNLFPWKGDSPKEVIRKIVFLIAIIVFGVCAFLIFNYFYENYKSRHLYNEIAKEVPVLEDLADENLLNTTLIDDQMLPYMETLVAMNPDTVGYIQIPDKNTGSCKDSGVDYPIVQKREGDPEYYLRRNFRGESAEAGTLFLDYRNVLTGSERSGNLIVYGHEMYDGSMFGNLKKYVVDSYFYETHPLVILSSRYEVSTYKIFGYYYADGGRGECDFYYTDKIDFGSEDEFYEYVNQIKKRAWAENGVDVKYGDELLTLSTCATDAYHDARFVVAARKLRPGEDKYAGTEYSKTRNNPLMPREWYKAKGEEPYFDDTDFVPYG